MTGEIIYRNSMHNKKDSVTMYSAEGSWKTTMKTYREDSDLMVEVPSITP